jgi:hypothetical protein
VGTRRRAVTAGTHRAGDPLSDVRSSLACLTPNLMLIGRDLAHGFHRTGLKVNDQTAGQTRMPI